MSHQPTIAILAGGRSRRMGFDKAGALLAGTPMLVHVARAAAQVSDAVWIVGRTAMREWPPEPTVRFLADEGSEPIGPVAGILAVLKASGAAVLVLGCDIPLVTPAAIEALWHFYGAQSPPPIAALGVTLHQGRLRAEPVFAVYGQPCAALLHAIQAAGGSLQELLQDARVARFDIPPAMAAELLNVNDPAALAEAEAKMIARTSLRSGS